MAGPKQKATTNKPAKPSARKKAAKSVSVQKRAARDVDVGPSAKRIERSLNEGTKQTLDVFRSSIDWS